MTLAAGNVTDYAVEPPMAPIPDRIPVTDADRRGVLDPMTSMLNRVGGSGDPVSPEACNRKVAVFDGRVRYDLHSEFRRMETVKADRGYEGPAVVCAVSFTSIAGYVPDRPAIKYLVALRDAEVWLAPIAGTRVLVPFRFAMPTPLGTGILRATEFVSVAQPSRAVASDGQNAVNGAACGGRAATGSKPSPLSTTYRLLTHRENHVCTPRCVLCRRDKPDHGAGFHPIWYGCLPMAAIYRSERTRTDAELPIGAWFVPDLFHL